DGQMLGIVSMDHTVRVWSVTGRSLVGTFGPVSVRSPVCFSPDGRRLASGDDTGEIRIWDLSDGRLVQRSRAQETTIWDICYTTNLLITAGTDQSIRIWDAASLTEQAVLRGHSGEVWKLAMSPDSKLLASGAKERAAGIWNLRQSGAALVPARAVMFWQWPVFSEDGAFLAVGEWAGVRVWRTDDGSIVQTLAKTQRPIAFTSGSRELITLRESGELQFWNWAAEPRQPTATIPAGLTAVRAHALCSQSGLLALGSGDGRIRLFDLRQRPEIRSGKAHKGQINSLAMTPDGLCLASGGVERESPLKLWNLPNGTLKAELSGHKLGVFGVAFSADGQLLASASVDDTCRLWNPTSNKEITTLGGHKGGAFSAAFSADGRTLLVGTGDRRVRMWNLATFRDLGAIEVEPVSVFFTGFIPKQSSIATVSFDGAHASCSLCLLGTAPARSAMAASSSSPKPERFSLNTR